MDRGQHRVLRTKASLVVLIIDDYTKKVLRDSSVTISIANVAKPIIKSEGYYVFQNIVEEEVHVHVKSHLYSDELVTVNLKELDPREPIIKIRVRPNRHYKLPDKTTCIEGLCKPFSEVKVVCDIKENYLRLLYDYNKQDNQKIINIFNPKDIDLQDRWFNISSKNSETQEKFKISGHNYEKLNQYELTQPLIHDYKKVETNIIPILSARADENGSFLIIVGYHEFDDIQCQFMIEGNKETSIAKKVVKGIINKFDFNDV